MATTNNNENESFFKRLQKLFRSGPAIRRKIKGYDDKLQSYDRKALLATRSNSSGMLPIGRSGGSNGQLSLLNGSDIMSRMVRYETYQEMELTPLCSKALDIIADETCSGDERGRNFHVYSDNPKIKATLEELFYDILNVDFQLRVWVRNMVKYGDAFLFIDVLPGIGIVSVQSLRVNEVERQEGFDPSDPDAVRFKWERLGQRYLENWQIAHFRILGNDSFGVYGSSILESARKIWQIYVMQIDAMLTYRLVRSPERRVFYIDVGNQDVNSIPSYLNSVMATIKGDFTTDHSNGRMDERFAPMTMLDDFIVPVRGSESGTKIDTLPAGQHVTAIEDIELIQTQLIAALGVPKAYLGFEELLGAKATLSQVDMRFAKTIQVIQKIIISELNKLATLHLYARGFDGEDLIDYELKLSNPSIIALQQKLELWKTKIDIIGAVSQIEGKFLPWDLLYKEIMGFTENEITGIKEKLKEDKRFAAELNSITEPLQSGQNVVDTFDTSHYIPPGGMPFAGNSSLPPDLRTPSINDNQINIDPSQIQSDMDINKNGSMMTDELPIKDNPQVQRDLKNSKRRSSDLEKLSAHTDINRMMNSTKTKSLKDLYDTEFLNSPLNERFRIEISKDQILSRTMKKMLENFSKFQENKKILTEEIQRNQTEKEIPLNDIIVETIEDDEISLEMPQLNEIGLDLKDDPENA